MNKEDLKKLIKPIIKECIHEVIIEEGILSKMITEVAQGLQVAQPVQQPIVEQQQRNTNQEAIERQKQRLTESRQMLTKAVGAGAYSKIFEGIEPMDAPKGNNAPSNGGALSDIAPNDPGVDISGIMAIGGRNWKQLATAKKR